MLFLPAMVALPASAKTARAEPASLPEYKVKARIIRKLLDYLEWPNMETGRPIVVAVLEPSPFEDHLVQELGNGLVRGRSVKFRLIRSIPQIDQCDVIFIPDTWEENLDRLLGGMKGKPIISISDTPGFASRGVIVNLAPAEGKTRLEVNLESLKRSGVTLSPQLLKFAIIVR